jgi:hypothetical protein
MKQTVRSSRVNDIRGKIVHGLTANVAMRPRDLIKAVGLEQSAKSAYNALYLMSKEGLVYKSNGKYLLSTAVSNHKTVSPPLVEDDEVLRREIADLRAVIRYLEGKL